jgi:hypothetical protein
MIEITEKLYRNLMIVVGVIAVALLPFWPYSRWGYTPAIAALALLVALFATRILVRE